eukprot:TRINITY_DN6249_c0_g1_i1.p1 TRINITY_DN6249_c0_g1~~TRINITY_DN6249_c0_g1_i1.p1  ORF type:complete len:121 (+),score=12.26 TRINITY_DN6249_c0_g1_i1:407-769(+)
MMPHKDSLGNEVAIISLISHTVLDFYYRENPVYAAFLFENDIGPPSARVLMEPNSLLLLTGKAFHKHMHGIYPHEFDIVDDGICNKRFTEIPMNTSPAIKRTEIRISIVLWTDENQLNSS